MIPKNKKPSSPSELRFDLASKDWVVIATGRARRPETFKKEKRQKGVSSTKNCPFCHLENQKKPVLMIVNGEEAKCDPIPDNWTTAVIPNLYPAFVPSADLDKKTEGGLYQKMNAIGFHEVVITRDHNKSMGQMEIGKIKEVMDAYQKRYLDLMCKKFVNNISIFHNHGIEAGASISHPHSQIITTYLTDGDINKALAKSGIYYKKNKRCLYCQMISWERRINKRIIFENDEFIAICPFASKVSFEIIITPKKHLSSFEVITEEEKWQLAQVFQAALGKLYKGLNDPPYNFYLHTALCDGKGYPHYHWHWTILPKTATWAGFEMGTRMEISTIEPEKAADYLKKQKI